MATIEVTTPDRNYEVRVEPGILGRAGSEIARVVSGRTAFIVTDRTVRDLYLAPLEDSLRDAGFRVTAFAVTPGEGSKSLAQLGALYERMLDSGLTRTDVVVVLGGGVPGDLGGLAAATWMRGVPLVQIPTTLLAQVDASLGGKTAVDLPRGKNLVGAFHQPVLVLTDPDLLATLPARVRADGLAESLKHGALFDPELFSWCADGAPDARLTWAVARNVRHKARVVSLDARESGERMLLNFGHTLGHAVEALTGFEEYTHGEAVAIGMVAAVRLGIRMGRTPASVLPRVQDAVEALNLPSEAPGVSADRLVSAVVSDKKNLSGQLHLVLLDRIGGASVVPVAMDEAAALIREVW